MDMRKMHACRIAGVIAVAAASGVEAQSLNSRFSRLEYAGVYGAADQTSTASGLETRNTLDLSDSLSQAFTGSRKGFVLQDPLRPFFGAVGVSNGQNYSITGPVSQFTRIEASGLSESTADASDEGLAQMIVPSLGNRLEFQFMLGSSVSANFSGSVSLATGASFLNGWVTLQRFDGIVWVGVFDSFGLPGQQGSFNVDLELIAGEYRLIGDSNATAFAGGEIASSTVENSWSYDLTIVPAPASAIVLAAGGLLRRRRR